MIPSRSSFSTGLLNGSTHNNFHVYQRGLMPTLIVSIALLLSACSGSSDDDKDDETDDQPDPIISTLSDDELKENAVSNFGDNLNSGFSSADDVSSDALTTLPGETAPTTSDEEPVEPVDNSIVNLIRSSMALNDESGDRTTREGNRVTIDPDETEVCAEDASGNEDQAEIERCEALVRDMTVILDSNSETAGTISYLFQDQPVLNIDYSENTDSVEVLLNGLKTLSDADAALDPDSTTVDGISTVTGAIRLSATNVVNSDGSEAGSLSFDITQPINLVETGASSLSMDTGTLFKFSVDEATETGSIEFDIGQVLINLMNEVDGESEVTDFDLDGLTAIISLDSASEALTVSNLSLGNGPFIVAINSEKVMDISLDVLGFSVSEQDGTITIDRDLNLSAFINEAVGEDIPNVAALATLFEVMAPGGTQLTEQDNGSLLVLSGGPLGVTLTGPDDNEIPMTTSVTVEAGQCLGEMVQGIEEVPAIVVCDQ